jgi:hypothetical protein
LPAPGPDAGAAALPAGALADASASSVEDRIIMEDRIRRSFSRLAERTIAASWPARDAAGAWRSPAGKAISPVFLISSTRPAEQDGVPTTAFVSLSEGLYWVHEGGGISGIDQWYGPFPVP